MMFTSLVKSLAFWIVGVAALLLRGELLAPTSNETNPSRLRFDRAPAGDGYALMGCVGDRLLMERDGASLMALGDAGVIVAGGDGDLLLAGDVIDRCVGECSTGKGGATLRAMAGVGECTAVSGAADASGLPYEAGGADIVCVGDGLWGAVTAPPCGASSSGFT